MQNCDVLIVGGGPAGSSLAWKLRGTPLDILILDKQTFPRDKVCAGWVTPAVMDILDIDLQDYKQHNTLQPISGFRVSKYANRQVETCYDDEPVSYGIRRREFDNYLLQRCGARTLMGTKFQSMRRDGGDWIINDSIRTPLVIGAGGHFCPVVRKIGARLGHKEKIISAQEVEFEMTPEQASQCKIQQEIPELFFCDDLTGYGWVFRKGNYLNIGLGRESNHKLADHVQAFCRFLQQTGKVPQQIPDKFHGHAYLLYPYAMRQVVDDGVLIIGDAAGLAYPQSGEGIRPAVESALLAAQVIRQVNRDYAKQTLQAYHRALVARFGQRETESFTDKLPGWLKQFVATRLMASEWFVRNVVMDKWFLQLQQSPLVIE